MPESTEHKLLQLINVGAEIIPLDELCNVIKQAEIEPIFETRRNRLGWPVRIEIGTKAAYSLEFDYDKKRGIYGRFKVEYPSEQARDAAYEVVLEALKARGQIGNVQEAA